MSAKANPDALRNRFVEVMQDQQSGSLAQLRDLEDLWPVMREEAQRKATEEPILGMFTQPFSTISHLPMP